MRPSSCSTKRATSSSCARASTLGYGYLDEGDTPAFTGVLEAAEFAVGSTVSCVEGVLSGE